jgi:hypothetical protein
VINFAAIIIGAPVAFGPARRLFLQ